ncbi:unnamed protein product [Vitrella brassicaformis CCMP3155]|uniref:Reverse transcriptase domain-containing protein n=1 Tax=Vitrella brassicaformis (strain CCMP3155) TaxID=1169540 RepID=A0A0G4H151_VITBC|nr:unnamed protein product [Vitrella brassicaformis CCMP3155]|eukprot:CEM37263.1 unnamed protein product [Vitrella brassicaformis CCMP3155]
MDKALAQALWTSAFVYVDDIVIFSRTFEEHCGHILDVFRLLQAANIKVKPSKCTFFARKISILGFLVSEKGLQADPKKVEKMISMPEPTDKKEVRSILGLFQYYKRFVPSYADLARPLTDLTKKEYPFVWRDAERNALLTLKKKMLEAPILALPDFKKPFILKTDASGYAVGAILCQRDGKGQERPIHYASAILGISERKWSATEREAHAIYYAVRHFRPYLFGQRFELVSDHQALRALKFAQDGNRKLQRWSLMLQDYDFVFRYRPGKRHTDVDALSRPCGQENNECVPVSSDADTYQLGTINLEAMDDSKPFHVDQIIEAQDRCADVSRVKAFLTAKDNNASKEELDQLHDAVPKAYWSKLYDACLLDGLVRVMSKHQEYGPVLLVPTSLREEAMKLHHEHLLAGHLAIERGYKRMAREFYWPGMYESFRKHIEACAACQSKRNLKANKRPTIQIPPAERPFQRVAMDFIGPLPPTEAGNQFALTVQDEFT